MKDDEKAGFVRAFILELADVVRALYPDDNLIRDDLTFKNNPIERDEDGILRTFTENHLVIKRNAHFTELDALLENINQTMYGMTYKHHLVEPYLTHGHSPLVEFHSTNGSPGYGDFYLSPYFTVKFKE